MGARSSEVVQLSPDGVWGGCFSCACGVLLMTTSLTQDDFNRLTSQLAASNASLNTAMAGLISSNAQFTRSAADADSNIGLSKSQYFLPSELTAARAIDSTVDQDHRSELPASLRDTNPLRPL